MTSDPINWLAVLASVVAMQAIGALWYSPLLFGKAWLKAVGKSQEDLGSPSRAMANAVVMAIFTCVAMAMLVSWTGASGAAQGLMLGLIVGIGFCAAVIGTNAGFEGRPFTLIAINSGHYMTDMIAVALILTLWK